ncbi:MAG TPA: hypothetical protein VFR41_03450, partial [Acidimicrobiia bacterium]|nr:hypothetical protein [Acidimicrobiia bacterium]
TGRADGDEAVVALMANSVLHIHAPVFFWGQPYGGTGEVGVVAALFAVFGHTATALKTVPVMLTFASAFVLARLAGNPNAGLLFLLYPPAFILLSTKEYGYYALGLLVVVAIMLFTLRLAQQTPATREVVIFGFLVGFGVWTSPQALFVIVPTVAWLLVRRRRELRAFTLAIPAALVGASPWIVWNLAHRFKSLHQLPPGIRTTYTERVRLFFARLLPMTLGLRRPYSGSWLFGPAIGVTLYVVALVAFAALCWLAVRSGTIRARFGLFIVVALAYPVLFAVPKNSFYVQAPRYALMLTPIIVVLVAANVRRPVAAIAMFVVAGALAAHTVAATIDYGKNHPLTVDLIPPRMQPLEEALTRAGVSRVYADYWLAYTLTFDSSERIIGSPVDFVRSLKYRVAADAAPRSTYVVFRDRPRDRALRTALDARAIEYTHADVAMFSIYFLRGQTQPSTFAAVWKLPSP